MNTFADAVALMAQDDPDPAIAQAAQDLADERRELMRRAKYAFLCHAQDNPEADPADIARGPRLPRGQSAASARARDGGAGMSELPTLEEQFDSWWASCTLPGEFDAMDQCDQQRWRGVALDAFMAGVRAVLPRPIAEPPEAA